MVKWSQHRKASASDNALATLQKTIDGTWTALGPQIRKSKPGPVKHYIKNYQNIVIRCYMWL